MIDAQTSCSADNARMAGAISSLIDELSRSNTAEPPSTNNTMSTSMPTNVSYFDDYLPFFLPEDVGEGFDFLTQNDEVSSEQLASFDVWLGQFGSEIES